MFPSNLKTFLMNHRLQKSMPALLVRIIISPATSKKQQPKNVWNSLKAPYLLDLLVEKVLLMHTVSLEFVKL